MLTAYLDVDFVKEAIQKGAYDYILKPYHLDKLEGTIRRALQNIAARVNYVADAHDALQRIVGESRPVQEMKALMLQYGPGDAPVLIQGESGTGKELVARALHQLSPRRRGPFVPINCGAIPESLLESELFGAERGAFTDAVSRPGCFEQANGGCIFLDEIGEMSQFAQVKLLRVLESKELTRVGGTERIALNLRVISATNRELQADVGRERFRRDLYYRIWVLPLTVPPLRLRKEDIPLLCAQFFQDFDCPDKKLHPAAIEKLLSHDWPGNIREMRNVIQRALVLSKEREVRDRDICFS